MKKKNGHNKWSFIFFCIFSVVFYRSFGSFLVWIFDRWRCDCLAIFCRADLSAIWNRRVDCNLYGLRGKGPSSFDLYRTLLKYISPYYLPWKGSRLTWYAIVWCLRMIWFWVRLLFYGELLFDFEYSSDEIGGVHFVFDFYCL